MTKATDRSVLDVIAQQAPGGGVLISVKESRRYRTARVLLSGDADSADHLAAGMQGWGLAIGLLFGFAAFMATSAAGQLLAFLAGWTTAGLVVCGLAWLTRPVVIRGTTEQERLDARSLAQVLNLHLSEGHGQESAVLFQRYLAAGAVQAALEVLHDVSQKPALEPANLLATAPADPLPGRRKPLYESRPGDPDPGARNPAADALVRAAELLQERDHPEGSMLLELVEYIPKMPMVDQDHIERAARAITGADTLLHEVPDGLRDLVQGDQESPRQLADGIAVAALRYLTLARDAAARSAIDDLRALRIYARQWEPSTDLLLELVDHTSAGQR